jgi:hypothetical protein
MTAKVTVEEVDRVAELAHLELGADESQAMLHDLNAILDYVAELNELDTTGVERALAQAAKVDALAAKGDALPALAGVPVGIKDVLTMTGTPATAGSKICKGYMPPYDATAVTRLEAAGAVLLGKLNCDEFAMGSSNENSAYGPVRIRGRWTGCRVGRAAARRRRLRRGLRWRRWARIRADRSGSRRRSAGWWACCRRMGASRAMG